MHSLCCPCDRFSALSLQTDSACCGHRERRLAGRHGRARRAQRAPLVHRRRLRRRSRHGRNRARLGTWRCDSLLLWYDIGKAAASAFAFWRWQSVASGSRLDRQNANNTRTKTLNNSRTCSVQRPSGIRGLHQATGRRRLRRDRRRRLLLWRKVVPGRQRRASGRLRCGGSCSFALSLGGRPLNCARACALCRRKARCTLARPATRTATATLSRSTL